jgi:hypothetical protein
LRTGIPPAVWLAMDSRDLDTALDLVAEEAEAIERSRQSKQ